MLAYREWRAQYWRGEHPRPVLAAMVMQAAWRHARAVADLPPVEHDRHGLHAVLPGARYQGPARAGDCPVAVAGAVDVYGRVLVHEDGVIRAERARVLALRVLPAVDSEHCGYAYYVAGLWRRLADVVYCDCSRGWPARHDLSLDELERQLLRQYNVPRLPDGVGPWD